MTAIPANPAYAIEAAVAMAIADEAAELVFGMRRRAKSSLKRDGSIVTEADLAAADLIRARLATLFRDDAILTEEDKTETDRLGHQRCWIVDPIDGTQQYADGKDDYDVFIALAENGRIVVAVSVQPSTGIGMSATVGGGCFVRDGGNITRLEFANQFERPRLGTRFWLGAPGNLAVLEPLVTGLGGTIVEPPDGIGPRSFLPGADQLDGVIGLYLPGTEPADYEWDLATMDLFVREAGGWSTDTLGRPLTFNKSDPRFPDGVVLVASPGLGIAIVSGLGR